MAIKQVAFDIPSAIEKGLEDGTLFRFGGVIRDTTGAIVTHLKEVPVPKAKSNAILDFAKNNKYVLIGTAVVTAIAAAVGITYVVVKNKKNEEEKVPKCLIDFNQSFSEYLDSIKKGSVNEEKIDDIISALKEIQSNQENGYLRIDFSTENVNMLLDMIKDYTIKLAKANSFEIPEHNLDYDDKIAKLQHYLQIQKQVFEKCA